MARVLLVTLRFPMAYRKLSLASVWVYALLLTSCGGAPSVSPSAPSPSPAPSVPSPATVPLSGMIMSTGGQPLAGATVNVALPRQSQPAPGGDFTTVADTAGRYRFPYLVPGTYTITASSGGFQPRQTGVDVYGDTTLNLSLLPATLVAVGGVVTDASSGKPVVGASVSPTPGLRGNWPPYLSTDSAGRYRWEQFLIGDAALLAFAFGYEEQQISAFIDGTNSVNFALRPRVLTAVSGTVVDAATGGPIANATIRALYSGRNPYPSQPTATTTASGAYRLSGVYSGSGQFSATAAGYAAYSGSASAVVSEDGTTTLNFRLVHQ